MARLSNPQAAHFIASLADSDSAENPGNGLAALLSTEWVGFVALLGPVPFGGEGSAKVSAAHDPYSQMQVTGLSSNLERTSAQAKIERPAQSGMLEFHIGAVFVDPGVRKTGVGKALIEAALSEAETQVRKQKADTFECTIHVDTYNHAAVKLYQKMGFVVVGEETYAQQTVAPVSDVSRMIDRVAFLMELRRAVSQT
ncbi:hypothetical protein B0A55_03384 [Friedmanniomyces simplex]|uniref:N-acetyltransferase domain-containing protein n=1 Tax=Friedmanniomyces simplex TaxID=329884 RepID=A0A4U0XS56_9PEZI|nr:hypothetical protein B0A55_03384 [Friedmanniomyces simplex]